MVKRPGSRTFLTDELTPRDVNPGRSAFRDCPFMPP